MALEASVCNIRAPNAPCDNNKSFTCADCAQETDQNKMKFLVHVTIAKIA